MTDIDPRALALRVADAMKDEAAARREYGGANATLLRELDADELDALAAFLREAVEIKVETDTLKKAVSATTDATASYLPPDGIDASECISRILAATDNPEINAIMLENKNGNPQD